MAAACLFISGCNAFTLVGLLDTAPSETSPTGGGSSSTLTLAPDSVNVLVSQQRKFTATGGAGGYSYAVQEGPAGGTIDSSGLYVAPPVPGTYTIVVTDSADATYEATVMVTASTPLTITPVAITVTAGGSVAFAASGGVSSYTYTATAGSINGGTGFYTAPPMAGSYPDTQTVHVTDGTSTVDAVVTITSPPALQISPTTATLNTGAVYTFSASGGVLPYTYSATTGLIVAATGQYTAPGSAGPDTVKVTDAGGRTATASVDVVAPGGPLTINPSPASVDAGQSLGFTTTGGTPPYTYLVVAGGGSINSSGLYNAPPVGGSATVRVTDSAATPATLDSSVTINAPAPLQIAPSSLNLAVDGTATFSATGGIPPYSYSVLSGGAGGTVNSGSGAYTGPGVAGSDTVRVTDAASHWTNATVTLYFPLTIIPTDATVEQGDTYVFDASGGFPAYTYSFTGPGSIDPDGTYHASGATGAVTVTVADTKGNSSTAAVTVVSAVGPWSIRGIDTSARSGQYASLALSPAGSHDPQIAYYESKNKELRLEKWNGASWTRQTVDTTGTVGQYASLALDAGANARISYYDATNRRLRYASWNGSSWTKQTVDSGGDLGKYTSLALDSTGKPRISYYDVTNRRLKYASWNGSSWTKQVVDSGADVGMYSSLALDAAGKPRIAYFDNTGKHLKYASWTGTTWNVQTVDASANVGTYSSLALDGAGNPHIAYYDAGNAQLKYVSAVGTVWGAPAVVDFGNVGTYSSLAIDTGGNPHISYYDAGSRHLKYANWTGIWNLVTVDTSNNVGTYSSLRYDSSVGKARIAYYNSSSQDLKYAKEQ